ncbi:hypothetical protein BI335_00365 [Enemella evansiae]|uniref:ester cyclase n=1 Tax=Enemella evansiae TaxID=2016499 RepID=UPI000B95D9A6|nr:ester cyclase [Enemella evansiae]OYO20063.1 hypothetical protein BI335_00365 [Enemella evansiae]
MPDRSELLEWYRRYLDACNRRVWDELGGLVADSVLVNGVPRTRAEYIEDLTGLIAVFPDYVWELRRSVIEGEWLAVHLRSTGTRVGEFMGVPGDGSRVETDEFDMYRIVDGRIVEVEGTADNARLCR